MIDFTEKMMELALEVPEGFDGDIHLFHCRLIGVVDACMGVEMANRIAERVGLPHLIKHAEEVSHEAA